MRSKNAILSYLMKMRNKVPIPSSRHGNFRAKGMSFKAILILIFKKLSNGSSQWFRHFIFYQKCLYNFSVFANIIPCYLIVPILMRSHLIKLSPKRSVLSVIFLCIYWLSVGIFFKDIYALVLCPFLNYGACFVDF